MGFDLGLWDRLFGEKITVEVPGPGGTRRVRVTARWLAKMEREGKVTPAQGEYVTVHILDPLEEYHTATWTVGQDISKEDVAAFLDESTQALYVLCVYRDGKRQTMLLRKHVWDDAKRKFDAI